MTPRSTETRRKARVGLACIRIGSRVYWVPTADARRIEAIAEASGSAKPEAASKTPDN